MGSRANSENKEVGTKRIDSGDLMSDSVNVHEVTRRPSARTRRPAEKYTMNSMGERKKVETAQPSRNTGGDSDSGLIKLGSVLSDRAQKKLDEGATTKTLKQGIKDVFKGGKRAYERVTSKSKSTYNTLKERGRDLDKAINKAG